MPRLSNQGNIGMGIAGIQGSVNGELIPELFGPYWIQDDHVVCIHNSDTGIWLYNPFTHARAPLDSRAANELNADGNVWAAWLSGYGLYSSTGIHFPNAGLMDVGPDGAIGYVPARALDNGVEVLEMNGVVWTLTSQPCAELNLLGAERAVWRDFAFNFNIKNLPPLTTIPGTKWHPHAIQINGEWWISYLSSTAGLVLHPFNSTIGYRIAPYSDSIYHPDAVTLSDHIVRTAFSITNGEGPTDARFWDTDINDPRIELDPKDEIVIIGKPCWLTWFEFNQPPPVDPPGNSIIKIRYEDSGAIYSLEGIHFANWVDGASVDEINAKIQASEYPCVVYWDGRVWPVWPTLRPQDWLCIYGYCFYDESPANLETALRGMIEQAQQRYQKLAINCQCYTSASVPNPPRKHLTSDLMGLVPVYARMAQEYDSIDMLTVFSDQNRLTGLNDHPELRPYWETLYSGITGEPGMAEQLPSEVCAALHRERNKYGAIPTSAELAQILNDATYGIPDFGVSRKDAGNHVNSPERPGLGNIASDIVQRQSNNAMWDVLVNAGGPATVNCGESIGFQEDPARPWVAPVRPPNPTFIGVVITDYDKVYHRNNPKGLLVYFDVTADQPVVKVDLELLDDGEPSIPIMFLSEERRDGRYVRALSFKPTVNGSWVLRVTATDSQGNTAFADGPIPVTVTF